MKSFAGSIVYYKTIKINKSTEKLWLDLGNIRCVSELEVNGKRLGAKWYGDHLYDITDAVVSGDNYLQVTLITTLGNYMKTLKNNKAAKAWAFETPYYPMGLTDGVRLYTIG